MKKAQDTYRTPPTLLIHAIRESHENKECGRQLIWKSNGKTLPKCKEGNWYLTLRDFWRTPYSELKEVDTETYNNHCQKSEKIWKAAKEKWLLMYKSSYQKTIRFLSRNLAEIPERSRIIYSKCWKKISANQNTVSGKTDFVNTKSCKNVKLFGKGKYINKYRIL